MSLDFDAKNNMRCYMDKPQSEQNSKFTLVGEIDKIMIGGLIAFSLIIIQAFISMPVLDPPAFISMIAFSIALPILVSALVHDLLIKMRQGTPKRPRPQPNSINDLLLKQGRRFAKPTFSMVNIGFWLTIGGIIAALWHASWIFGVLCLISGAFAFIVYFSHILISSYDMDS